LIKESIGDELVEIIKQQIMNNYNQEEEKETKQKQSSINDDDHFLLSKISNEKFHEIFNQLQLFK